MHYFDAQVKPNIYVTTKYQNGGLFSNLSAVLRPT